MGSGNPGDKPGYKVIALSAHPDEATKQLNDAQAEGYELLFVIGQFGDRAILGNYKKGK